MLVIRVNDDGYKFSFWYIEVLVYYVHSLVYLCRSLLEQQIKLVLNCLESGTVRKVHRNRYSFNFTLSK